MRNATLYLHFPCFDGVVSATLASDFLERQGWNFKSFSPVSYDLRRDWALSHLHKPCAIVDFLYHKDADFWADHHSTTFLSPRLRTEYKKKKSPWFSYDDTASSCAELLWKNLAPWPLVDREKYQDMVDWAAKIDSARYADPREAIVGDAPSLQINRSLLRRSDAEYCSFLIRALRNGSLADVARLPEVLTRAEEARSLIESGLNRVRQSARLASDDIVIYQLNVGDDEIINRYAPFYFFPEARYSMVLLRSPEHAKITAMRNPWLEFQNVPLGRLFQRFGGGGHQRVASLLLARDRPRDTAQIFNKLLSEIEQQDGKLRRQAQDVLA